MSFQTDLWVSVYDPWTGYVVPNAFCVLYEYRTGTNRYGYTDGAGLWHVGWVDTGQFLLVVSKANYNDFMAAYGVGGDYLEIQVALIPIGQPPPPPPPVECSILFRVFNEAGTRLSGASVTVDGVSGSTDSQGTVLFTGLILKTYNWSVTLNGYHDAAGQILCGEAKQYGVDVTMVSTAEPPPPPPAYYNLVVYVKDSGDGVTPVVGVDVRCTEKTMPPLYDGVGTTNSSGAVAFNGLPSGGYRLQAWTKSQSYYDSLDVVLDANKSATLYLPTEYSLTINGGQGGVTQPSQGVYIYARGASVTVSAVPNSGYAFDYWVLDGVTYTQNPIGFTMNTGHSLTPFFRSLAPQMRYLTISKEKGGSTDPVGGIIQYPQGTSVTVTAIPDSGYLFSYWTLDGAKKTENPTVVTMNVDHVLIPFFLGQGEVPVDWDAPAEYKSGVYEWSLRFNIAPIPFLSSWIAELQSGQQDDQANINRIMAERGATGTATILSKAVSMHANWYGAVDYFTIKYTVAFTGSIQPTVEVSLFPWVVLIPYIPAILSIISLIIIGLIIYNITSTIRMITGPDEYKPQKDGECASGWVWDDAKKLCVKKGIDVGQLILIGGGVIVAATVLPKMLEGRGKKKS